MQELLSIIVPIYNTSNYLEKCIQSILDQTYTNIEIILVNDGSTDNSLDICKKYQLIDQRIILLDEANNGVSSARNKGLQVAKGEYIGFVDGDDSIKNTMYSDLYESMGKYNAEISVLANYAVRQKRLSKVSSIPSEEALRKLALLEYPASVCTCLYSKTVIAETVMNVDVHFFEDFLFNFDVLQKATNIALSFENSYEYHHNRESANRRPIDNKKLTCLDIRGIVKADYGGQNDMHCRDELNYFWCHCLITVIVGIAKSRKSDGEFFTRAKDYNRTIISESLVSKYVTLKYKLVMLAFFVFPKTTIRLIRLLRFRLKDAYDV